MTTGDIIQVGVLISVGASIGLFAICLGNAIYHDVRDWLAWRRIQQLARGDELLAECQRIWELS